MEAVAEAVARTHREHWGAVLAATVRLIRDLDTAEECVQDAYARALSAWPETGIPERPEAWLKTVAGNRARDLLRRESLWRRALPLLVEDDTVPDPQDAEPSALPDDMLRLVFTCCHPALAQESRVALTLRLVCGLSTAEVARAFLVSESTMAARITRAKKKIAAARIPYRVPDAADLPGRLSAVCEVVHLVFTTGQNAPVGPALIRDDLVACSLHLARTLHRLLPDADEPVGLLALLLLVDARRAARVADDGSLILLADQDRTLWDHGQIAEGVELLTAALRSGSPTRYAVQAAIAAVHAEAPTFAATDWSEIVALYGVLRRLWPNPVVDLNRAVALGMRDGPQAGLDALDLLVTEPTLATYRYHSATRADFLRRLERWPEAVAAYEEALLFTDNEPERAFLEMRLAEARGRISES